MGQLAYLEKDLPTNPIKLSTKMALRGSRLYCFPCQNLLSINLVKNELARDPGPVRGPHSGSISLVPSCNLIPGPALVPTLIPVPVSALAPILSSSNEFFKQFMKAYLELNQGPR